MARSCRICQRGKFRVAAGWPVELAYTIGPIARGYGYCHKTQQVIAVKKMSKD